MSEQELMTECAKEVAKEVYQDAGKPIAKPTGELVGLIPRAIKAALLPIEKWIVGREYNLAETKKLLEQKLANISPEQIEAPEAHIAVPAFQYISYCMDNEELRNMYANLLASSMNTAVKNGVHPSFVEIIKQLCPDEARIMKCMYKQKNYPVITLRKMNAINEYRDILKDFSDIGEEAKCEIVYDQNKYFNNLIRLGLLEKAALDFQLAPESIYDCLLNHPHLKKVISENPLEGEFIGYDYRKSFIYITEFGKAFCKACISLAEENK